MRSLIYPLVIKALLLARDPDRLHTEAFQEAVHALEDMEDEAIEASRENATLRQIAAAATHLIGEELQRVAPPPAGETPSGR